MAAGRWKRTRNRWPEHSISLQQRDRKVRFIFRQHMTGLGPITEAFADFPGEFATSFKYAIGHMYSMRKPEQGNENKSP